MASPVGYGWKEWEHKKQELLEYCLEEEWEKFVHIYENHPTIQTAKLTASKETALHIAVSEGKEDTVKRLVEVIEFPQATLSMEDDEGNMPLHLAALIGNVGICKCIVKKNKELLDHRNYKGETPLFLAALRGQKNAFLYLDQICIEGRQEKYYRRRSDGQTILHVAISGQYFELAYQILLLCKYDDELIRAVDNQGYTALHLLASNPAVFISGSRPDGFINRIIYHCLHVEKLNDNCRRSDHTDMHKHFSGELKNTENYPENYKTVSVTDRDGLPAPSRNHMEANKQRIEELEEGIRDIPQNQGQRASTKERPQIFPPNYQTSIMILRTILGLVVHILVLLFGLGDERKKVKEKKEKNIWSVQTLDLMLRKSSHHDYSINSIGGNPKQMPEFLNDQPRQMGEGLMQYRPEIHDEQKVGDDGESKMSFNGKGGFQKRETPILIAAKNGITEMVKRILQVSPMAILDRDSEGNNIVLLSVKNRQTELYELLVKRKPRAESAFHAIDAKGNSVLHVAARLDDSNAFPLASLRMQWEIKWFKYVKNSVPRNFFTSRNNENKTADEVFMETHENLIKEGGGWLITTSNSCSVVATVVATVAFATTASIPGGLKEGSSRPKLEKHPSFIVFIISSLIALSFSVTSVIAFLSIITPGYGLKDFEKHLPKKMLYALTYLYTSLVAMVVCFCAGHFFLMRDDLEHHAFMVYGIACLPVAYFTMKQFPFYVDLLLDTFLKMPRHKPRSYYKTRQQKDETNENSSSKREKVQCTCKTEGNLDKKNVIDACIKHCLWEKVQCTCKTEGNLEKKNVTEVGIKH